MCTTHAGCSLTHSLNFSACASSHSLPHHLLHWKQYRFLQTSQSLQPKMKSKRRMEGRQAKGEANPHSNFLFLWWCCELLHLFSGGNIQGIPRLVYQKLLMELCRRCSPCCQTAVRTPAGIGDADKVSVKELESLLLHGMKNHYRNLPKDGWSVGKNNRHTKSFLEATSRHELNSVMRKPDCHLKAFLFSPRIRKKKKNHIKIFSTEYFKNLSWDQSEGILSLLFCLFVWDRINFIWKHTEMFTLMLK